MTDEGGGYPEGLPRDVPTHQAREDGVCGLGVGQLASLYRTRALSPVEVTGRTLDRIARLNPVLNAYITVLERSAQAAARAAEMQLVAGVDVGPFQGIPVSVKDLIRVRHARTTAASRVLQDAPVDDEDAPVVRRLRAAGAILLGKTNLDPFGVSRADPDGPFGLVQNPRRLGYQAGGSSSGSAAAVAAGLSIVSLGTDAGGSVRHPASVCGVVGLKPTHGLVTLRGVISSSPRLDHIGVLGRSVFDVAAGLAAITGQGVGGGALGSTADGDYVGSIERDVRHLRVGLPTNACFAFGRPDVRAALDRARGTLVDLGLIPVTLEVPWAEAANAVADILLAADHFTYHRPRVGSAAPYGADFLERFERWQRVSAADHAQAMETRAAIRRAWRALFEQVDVLTLPANAAGAPPHGAATIDVEGVPEPIQMVNSRFNRISNLTGFPALVLPIGQTAAGLPVGMQLIGSPWSEARLLAVGYALERALGDLPAAWGIEPVSAP